MKTIAIINQKGGVGKTTTVWALATRLTEMGKKVLAVDIDSQINLSLISKKAQLNGKTIYDALGNPDSIIDCIQSLPGYDLLPGSQYIPNIETQLSNEPGRELRLKEALSEVEEDYDYCIIDTSPSLSVMTLNALTAADTLVLPAFADYLSITSINTLYNTFLTVKKYLNADLKIAGILLTRYNARTRLSQAMVDEFSRKAEELNTRLFKSTIREAVVIRESQLLKESLYEYAPKAKVTKDYEQFVDELLKEIDK